MAIKGIRTCVREFQQSQLDEQTTDKLHRAEDKTKR